MTFCPSRSHNTLTPTQQIKGKRGIGRRRKSQIKRQIGNGRGIESTITRERKALVEGRRVRLGV